MPATLANCSVRYSKLSTPSRSMSSNLARLISGSADSAMLPSSKIALRMRRAQSACVRPRRLRVSWFSVRLSVFTRLPPFAACQRRASSRTMAMISSSSGSDSSTRAASRASSGGIASRWLSSTSVCATSR